MKRASVVSVIFCVEETLRNVALPPNRATGQTGFLVHETDGRLQKGMPPTNPTSIL